MDVDAQLQFAGNVLELVGTLVTASDVLSPREHSPLHLDEELPESRLARLSEALVEKDRDKLQAVHSDLRDAAMQAAGSAARGFRSESLLRRRGKVGLVVLLVGMAVQTAGAWFGLSEQSTGPVSPLRASPTDAGLRGFEPGWQVSGIDAGGGT
jgi:hypothetical protein